MTEYKLFLANIIFENKILKANGSAFEDLFAEVMISSNINFQKIKAWGKTGDRKNDGYIREEATYYQVYAPETPENKHLQAIKKLKRDLKGLLKHWSPVEKFFFVFNDKLHGIHPDADKEMQALVKQYKLKEGKILTVKNLKNIFCSLDDNSIYSIAQYIPDPQPFSKLDYNVLNEVITYIMQLPYQLRKEQIAYPKWDEKIKFNRLSRNFEVYLNAASLHLNQLDLFLNHHPSQAEQIQKHLVSIYQDIVADELFNGSEVTGDNIFWELIRKCMPSELDCYFGPVIVIIAKYFESCDIFEEPK